MARSPLKILLVEDNENEACLLRQAVQQMNAGHTVQTVGNGEEATRYLLGQGQYQNREKFPLPNLLITDLEMPHMSGLAFLKWLRGHPECAVVPTIVFSSSRNAADVSEAYRLGANSYIAKPMGYPDLLQALRSIQEYWSLCERPSGA